MTMNGGLYARLWQSGMEQRREVRDQVSRWQNQDELNKLIAGWTRDLLIMK